MTSACPCSGGGWAIHRDRVFLYIQPLAELFRASILKMLKDEERLDDTLIKKVLTWRHNSGFSVHNEMRLQAGDVRGIENVA